jgi:hypothetical protein
MEKKIFFANKEKVFRDAENNDHYYCSSKEEVNRKNDLLKSLKLLDEKRVPAEYTIEVFRLGKIRERNSFTDEYNVISETPIDFPINRTDWIWVPSSF